MKEIIQLNRRVLAESKGKRKSDDWPTLSREEGPDAWRGFSPGLKAEARAVHEALSRHIPDDFSYTVDFGGEAPIFFIEYTDGVQTGMFQGVELDPKSTIEGFLDTVDWDEERGAGVEGCQIFDVMKEAAAKTPPLIHSTAALQKAFQCQMERWAGELRIDENKVRVLIWQGRKEFESLAYDTIAKFRDELPDLMTVQCHVIAVMNGKVPLTPERIDALKTDALKKLEDMPISHAKASGKFGVKPLPKNSREEDGDER